MSGNLYHLRETDQDGNITKIVFGDTSDSHGWAGQRILYSYDKAGRLFCTNNNDYKDICNEYDGNSRLTGFKTQVPRITDGVYAYDLNGNRTWSTDALGDRDNHISPFNNQLQTVKSGSTTQTLTYDQGGNLTQDGKFIYVTDARGKFSRVSGGGVDVRYAYNGLGERVKKEGSSGATLFVQDGYQVMGEYTATGAPVQETVYLDGLPIGVIKPSGLYYVNPDPLGSPLAITNATGTLVWSWEHAPFGDTLPNENPKGAGTFSYNLRFPGQYFDSETGYHYNNARTYLPKLGFYQQPDPIGLAGGINPYVYAENSPTNFIDSTGRNPFIPLYIAVTECATNPVCRNLAIGTGLAIGDIGLQLYSGGDVDWEEVFVAFSAPFSADEYPGSGYFGKAESAASKMCQAANTADRGGLTASGRALAKHGGRVGSAFPPAKGNPAAINSQAQQIVADILNNFNSTATQRTTGRFGNVTDIIAPDGRGLRYDTNGNFIGFLEP